MKKMTIEEFAEQDGFYQLAEEAGVKLYKERVHLEEWRKHWMWLNAGDVYDDITEKLEARLDEVFSASGLKIIFDICDVFGQVGLYGFYVPVPMTEDPLLKEFVQFLNTLPKLYGEGVVLILDGFDAQFTVEDKDGNVLGEDFHSTDEDETSPNYKVAVAIDKFYKKLYDEVERMWKEKTSDEALKIWAEKERVLIYE